LRRREFLRWTGLAVAGTAVARWPSIAGPFSAEEFNKLIPPDKKLDRAWVRSLYSRGEPTIYQGADLEKIGMPIGGICSGQLYLGGDGRLWHWDIFNLPQAGHFTSSGGPNYARPPKPSSPLDQGFALRFTSGSRTEVHPLDARGVDPRHIRFRGQYPMAFVDYADPAWPVTVALEAFPLFIPLNVEDSSLPATVLRYTVKNTSPAPVTVELAGWIENAVCLGSGRPGRGRRRNRALREPGMNMVLGVAEPLPPAQRPAPRPEIVFETFEKGYGPWRIEGEAFGREPATGTLPNQQAVRGFSGERLVNTYLGGDQPKGRLVSPAFRIERRHIAFLIGGGAHAGRTCVNLLVDGRVVRSATGQDNERLEWQDWEVSALEGQTASIEIVDQASEGWGHINLDQIVFTDEPPSARRPLTAEEDFGSMGLALLQPQAGDSVRTRVDTESRDLFADATPDSAGEAVVDFGTRLAGAVGRKFTLAPGAEAEAVFVVAWYFPGLLRNTLGPLQDADKLRRSYANRFSSAADVARYVAANFERLAGQTRLWNRTWYDSTLPYWFLDRTFLPICTLATNTCYQFDTGRFYAFEGVYCCQGTCQHVWNYAQSVARIFPELERDLRQRTDFGTAWHDDGATDYRGECAQHVAHDGQCGVILRAWREHLLAPDDQYLRATWPRIRKSVEYLIRQDADENGVLEGEQYNTLDAAWFGPMAWISSFYVAALRAGEAMAREADDPDFAERCRQIAERGTAEIVRQLYNGEYFIHRPDPAHPQATNTNDGCHIDQLMGQAWAWQVGLPRILPPRETKSALEAIWKYNFTPDVGPYREHSEVKGGRWYAMAGEGGVIMTTFPRGGAERSVGRGGFAHYFNEVWTGQEHQLAAHLLYEGLDEYALVVTRVLHDRHHAGRRNPYNEVECSDHYARAMASYGTFLAACGWESHGPKGHIGFAPRLTPDRFRAPFTSAEGWGTIAQDRDAASQTASVTIRYGRLRLRTLALAVPENRSPQSVRARLRGQDLPATIEVAGTRVLVRLQSETVIQPDETLEVTLT